MSAGSFYITTPIFYVNDVPHIGHAYTEVAADVLARWHRQSGDDAWLLTGTDEHGQKILRTAIANGVTPKEWADRLVETAWKPLLETVNIRNDDFIRTTDERHEVNAQKFLQHLHPSDLKAVARNKNIASVLVMQAKIALQKKESGEKK